MEESGARQRREQPGFWNDSQLLSWQAHFLEKFGESRLVAQSFQ